ncbi:hypothetical protein K490DRAFT_68099 [Saccharata proteae CBS 121410]|uniref:Uncharacterized protein n=1 Tax=Saccharata proteae CBS 121410 TaxID=1314787 RepID=A0A9P4HS89_9PEZI|nr:hypothetical protein K490DRAFT_68099 [Saccharata proteae CBS 121410]
MSKPPPGRCRIRIFGLGREDGYPRCYNYARPGCLSCVHHADWERQARFEDEDMMEFGYVQNLGPRWRQALHTEHDDEEIFERDDAASDTECVLDCLDAGDRPNGAISFEKREEMWEKAEREMWCSDKRIDTERMRMLEDAEQDADADQEQNDMTEEEGKERPRDHDEFADSEGLYNITPPEFFTRMRDQDIRSDTTQDLSPLASSSTTAFVSPWDNACEKSPLRTPRSTRVPVSISKDSIPVTGNSNMIEEVMRMYENEARRASGARSPHSGPRPMPHETTSSLNETLPPTVEGELTASRSGDPTTTPEATDSRDPSPKLRQSLAMETQSGNDAVKRNMTGQALAHDEAPGYLDGMEGIPHESSPEPDQQQIPVAQESRPSVPSAPPHTSLSADTILAEDCKEQQSSPGQLTPTPIPTVRTGLKNTGARQNRPCESSYRKGSKAKTKKSRWSHLLLPSPSWKPTTAMRVGESVEESRLSALRSPSTPSDNFESGRHYGTTGLGGFEVATIQSRSVPSEMSPVHEASTRHDDQEFSERNAPAYDSFRQDRTHESTSYEMSEQPGESTGSQNIDQGNDVPNTQPDQEDNTHVEDSKTLHYVASSDTSLQTASCAPEEEIVFQTPIEKTCVSEDSRRGHSPADLRANGHRPQRIRATRKPPVEEEDLKVNKTKEPQALITSGTQYNVKIVQSQKRGHEGAAKIQSRRATKVQGRKATGHKVSKPQEKRRWKEESRKINMTK